MKSKVQQQILSIGLMSGTSMDAIDAALIETDGLNYVRELGHTSLAYDPLYKISLKAAEMAVRKTQGNLNLAEDDYAATLKEYLEKELKQIHYEQSLNDIKHYLNGELSLKHVIAISTQLHAKAVKQLLHKLSLTAQEIDIIGYHGQALYHQPQKSISVIVGDGQSLANELGIKLINDFRRNDIEHGGHGAPFAPLYHLALCVRDHYLPAAVVNCGGIANITLIPDSHPEHLVAFDTGPGNGLIDRLVRQRTAGKEHMDKDGHYGKRGKVNTAVLETLFEKAIIKEGQNYFSIKPPKSLDIGDLHLISELENLSLEDACRTLEAFSAESLVRSLELVNTTLPKTWILAGGGWNNPVMLQELEQRLNKKITPLTLTTADQSGWNSQALEAQIFAYLAVRSLKKLPLSLPGTTGVAKAVSGGCLYTPSD